MHTTKQIVTSLLIVSYCLLNSACSSPSSPKGYPSREGKIDIRAHFADPPKGYGNVPFYWWNGDSLNKERLVQQLEIMSEASTDGFAVSYIHTHPQVDREINANGYGSFGKADPGAPGVFSDDWWELWNWFSGECADKGMGLGLDDYVIGWAKNEFYVDELTTDEDFANYQGRVKMMTHTVEPNGTLKTNIPGHWVSVTAYPAGEDLTSTILDDSLQWKNTTSQPQTIYIAHTEASYELHPEYGKRLVDVYFGRFEEKLDERGKRGMNYFFQDELHYNLNIHSWCEDMPEEFLRRKGYDIAPYLPALFANIGDITPKVRLDYADVVMQLSEERYFKPVFDWHAQRGLIYGCDNNGRGLEPLQYMDYFKSISWFTAPGNDAPARGSSFRQTKVSSSVAHLYERPRTWLEAFHSMGWDSNGEWLTRQLDHHIIAGGNLLCMHGLYYSTHGGWWEWAPPCFHFRMPYWPHMKQWLKYAERLCFLLSQGTHVCDIAVMYPTESLQAYPRSGMGSLWAVTDLLSNKGLDYDFINSQSIQQATTTDGTLSVADEHYRVLILADIHAMQHETLLKIKEFHQSGGIVIAIGHLPQATSRSGEDDPELLAILKQLFKTNERGIHVEDYTQVPSLIGQHITPDFQPANGSGKVLHRKVGNQEVYMVMDVEPHTEMFFRATGKAECWNAKDGSITTQPILRQSAEGTWIRFDGDEGTSRLIVFSPGKPTYATDMPEQRKAGDTLPLTGLWDIEIVPTLDNSWGDFRLPATDEMIGVEAREFAYTTPSGEASKGIYGYGAHMKTITLDASVDLEEYLRQPLDTKGWKPYCYSWQYGVLDQPGSQGYHGLKGKVDNRFLILDQGGHQLFSTSVYASKDATYRIEQEGTKPNHILVDHHEVTTKQVFLSEGWHQVVLAYANTPEGSYILKDRKSNSVDFRPRSAVVFYPSSAPEILDNHPYDDIVAMKWYGTHHLPYSTEEQDTTWKYHIETAPGTQSLRFKVHGKIEQIWIDGKDIDKRSLEHPSEGSYTLNIGQTHSGISTVELTAVPAKGYTGAAFFAEPVKMQCSGGKMPAGNWHERGALRFYSGGIKYSKTIQVPDKDTHPQWILDLGGVNATCEVNVNGKMVDTLISPPYRLDITRHLRNGDNLIEVLVYSTLAGHYQTIPSAYRGEPCSGLLGPVRLIGYK